MVESQGQVTPFHIGFLIKKEACCVLLVGCVVVWNVLSLGTFCPLLRFVPWGVLSLGTFCPWDILSLGTFCLLTFFSVHSTASS